MASETEALAELELTLNVRYGWLTSHVVNQSHILEETCVVPFVLDDTHELELDVYALRPCQHRGVADVIPAEVRAVHAHFNGSVQPARRSSATVLRKVEMNLIDETESEATDTERLGRLYDSDDDLGAVELEENPDPLSKSALREPVDEGEVRLKALRKRLEDDPGMIRDIDQLIALRQSNLSGGSSSSLIIAVGLKMKAQFNPSRQQVVVHNALVNGKYASLDSKLFVETIQTQAKLLDVLPHPGVARGFYGWDFGFRGLSVMHIGIVDVKEEHRYRLPYDMADFSLKNTTPDAPESAGIEDIVGALEMLSLLVIEMYAPLVRELVDAFRRFLLASRKTKAMCSPEAVVELVTWIDDCFELFRSRLARGDTEAASVVKTHFHLNHEVVQRVTALKLQALKEPTGPKSASTQKLQPRRTSGHGTGIRATIPVPPAVVPALPIRRGKKLCMRYFSVDGCTGEGDSCVFDYRGHFVSNKLPGIVKNHIMKAFGGLCVLESAAEECHKSQE
ncbi:hypothetical protein PHMEG_00010154 [Phytophthora megakarya]|uniref:Uncharacterized protein n=1 Tax=Phytophthora megakarya TaxID=4795 RepID=A0A225WEE7_9STRA|nr:hypothetical protein PHMEG_00010154 [Phytophthora megakarya]